MFIYNIIQTYILSKTKFNYIVIYHLLIELKKKYFKNIILCIMKLLYDLAKVRNN